MKAVAAGVPSLAPFFDEGSGLGHDTKIGPQQAHGGLQAGNTPGLYGGSKKPTICDVDRLKKFLTDPRNDKKAKVWAQVLGIPQDGIPDYIDRLTPVLLRHDTLVKNHDYKKGKAAPFDSLLQAGIAILVDEQGLPAVKCSCGNPLRPFEGDTTKISVKFEDGNKKWDGYDRSSAVAVKPAPQRLKRIALVDVEEPNRGINRPVGTTGKDDATFDTREPHKVPELAGMRFADATQELAGKGLAATYDGKTPPPDDAAVTGSDPAPGTELGFGQYVTLTVDRGATGGTDGSGTSDGTDGGTSDGSSHGPSSGTSTPPSSGGSSPGTPGESGKSSPPSSGGSTSSSPPSSGSSSPPTSGSSAPPSGGDDKPSASSSPPPSSSTPTRSSAPPSSPPPEVTSSPPVSDPVTSSAPATSAPATSEPASRPVTSDPATEDPAPGDTPTASLT